MEIAVCPLNRAYLVLIGDLSRGVIAPAFFGRASICFPAPGEAFQLGEVAIDPVLHRKLEVASALSETTFDLGIFLMPGEQAARRGEDKPRGKDDY